MGEGPLQRREEGRPSVGPLEVGDERQLRGQLRGTGGRCLAQERLGHRTETQEGDLGGRPGSQRPGRLLRRTAIVLVGEAHLAGTHERVAGDLGAGMADDQLPRPRR